MTLLGWILLITILILVFFATPKMMKCYIENENFRGGIGRLFFLTSFIISFCLGCIFNFRWVVIIGLSIALAVLSIVICELRIRR